MNIMTLEDCPDYVEVVARIYIDEWLYHYEAQYGISTVEQMVADIRTNFMKHIYVAFSAETDQFIGTIALLETDINEYAQLTPWITSFYIVPEFRKRGLGKYLFFHIIDNYLEGDTLYLLCYPEQEKQMYKRWGFTVYDEFDNINGHSGCIMVYTTPSESN